RESGRGGGAVCSWVDGFDFTGTRIATGNFGDGGAGAAHWRRLFLGERGGIGYLPDAHDVERRSYAAIQSPKFTGQFPFTEKSGPAMVEGLVSSLERVAA